MHIELNGVSTEWGGLLICAWVAGMTLAHWSENKHARMVAVAMKGFRSGVVIGLAVLALTGNVTVTHTSGHFENTAYGLEDLSLRSD